MSKAIAVKRLSKEYKDVQKNPDKLIEVRFDEDNMLNIYYLLTGSPDTPFEGGTYFGCIKVKENYPFAPPSIMMITPNGRFLENTRLCLSMSDFHPESWNPAWTATRSIPMALLSFMNSDERSSGCVNTSDEAKKIYAKKSMEWNCQNLIFKRVFADKVKEYQNQKDTEKKNKTNKKETEKKVIVISDDSSNNEISTNEDANDSDLEILHESPSTHKTSNTKSSLRYEKKEDKSINETDSEDTIRIKQSANANDQLEKKNSNKLIIFIGSICIIVLATILVKK